MATISFIPSYALGDGGGGSGAGTGSGIGTGSGTGNGTGGGTSVDGNYSYVEHFDQAFTQNFSVGAASDVLAAVDSFLTTNNIPKNAVIDSAQIVGGYRPNIEDASVGVDRARKFTNALDDTFPHLLEHSSTILSSSKSLEIGQVVVKFTFSNNVVTQR